MKTKNCPRCHKPPALEGSLAGRPHLICPHCDLAGPVGEDDDEARRLWNRLEFRVPKTPSACKSKGSEFERDQVRVLSLWLSGGERDDLLWRNKGQPNRRVKGRRRLEQFGDVHSIDLASEWFMNRVNIEFKFVRELDLLELVDRPKKKGRLFVKHWGQCKRDADDSGRVPVLIQKRNFGEPFVLMRRGLADRLSITACRVDLWDDEREELAVFPLASLLAVSPQDVRCALGGEGG